MDPTVTPKVMDPSTNLQKFAKLWKKWRNHTCECLCTVSSNDDHAFCVNMAFSVHFVRLDNGMSPCWPIPIWPKRLTTCPTTILSPKSVLLGLSTCYSLCCLFVLRDAIRWSRSRYICHAQGQLLALFSMTESLAACCSIRIEMTSLLIQHPLSVADYIGLLYTFQLADLPGFIHRIKCNLTFFGQWCCLWAAHFSITKNDFAMQLLSAAQRIHLMGNHNRHQPLRQKPQTSSAVYF